MGVVLLLLLTVSSMLLCDAFLLPFKASSSHKAPSCIAGVAPITGSSKPNTWLASTVGGGVEAGATERCVRDMGQSIPARVSKPSTIDFHHSRACTIQHNTGTMP